MKNICFSLISVATGFAQATQGITLERLSKADAVIQPAVVLLACAAASERLSGLHLFDLIAAPVNRLPSGVIFTGCADTAGVAGRPCFQADAVVLLAAAGTGAVHVLWRNVR